MEILQSFLFPQANNEQVAKWIANVLFEPTKSRKNKRESLWQEMISDHIYKQE